MFLRFQKSRTKPRRVANTCLTIGDSQAVQEFYTQCFKVIQQNTCKIVAKSFIKEIAPKKQGRHPYSKGNKSAPAWWPKDKVRHIEPDHQSKKGLCLDLLKIQDYI